MTTPNDSDRAERERLAALPGLSKNQREALKDPTFSMKLCRVLVAALRAQEAAFDAKTDEQKERDRVCGLTQHVNIGVVNDGPRQILGAVKEIPYNG